MSGKSLYMIDTPPHAHTWIHIKYVHDYNLTRIRKFIYVHKIPWKTGYKTRTIIILFCQGPKFKENKLIVQKWFLLVQVGNKTDS